MVRKDFSEKMAFENRGLGESVLKEKGWGAGNSQMQAERERGKQCGWSRVDEELRESQAHIL